MAKTKKVTISFSKEQFDRLLKISRKFKLDSEDTVIRLVKEYKFENEQKTKQKQKSDSIFSEDFDIEKEVTIY